MITGYGGSTATSTVTGVGATVQSFTGLVATGGQCRGCCWCRRGGGLGWRLPWRVGAFSDGGARRHGGRCAGARTWPRRVFQSGHEVAHHRAGIAPIGVDPHRRHLAVQRDPFGHQRCGTSRPGRRRPAAAARSSAGAPNPFCRTDFQVDHGVSGQRLAHAGAGHRAAAEGQHAVVARPARRGRPPPRSAGTPARRRWRRCRRWCGRWSSIDRRVGVQQRQIHRLGQPPADRRLARSRHADQHRFGRHQPDARTAARSGFALGHGTQVGLDVARGSRPASRRRTSPARRGPAPAPPSSRRRRRRRAPRTRRSAGGWPRLRRRWPCRRSPARAALSRSASSRRAPAAAGRWSCRPRGRRRGWSSAPRRRVRDTSRRGRRCRAGARSRSRRRSRRP